MSLMKSVAVCCDAEHCGLWFGASGKAAEVRRDARRAGWKRRDGKDVCPRHASTPAFGPTPTVTTWSGWALDDRQALLAQLDLAGVALEHGVVVCDHVTRAYPDTVAPTPVQTMVVGVASDASIQALVVEIDGMHVRPDGNIFHVTLSRRADVPDWASKEMILRAFAEDSVTWIGPWPITTSPILRRVDRPEG